jgi:uncharacterized protein
MDLPRSATAASVILATAAVPARLLQRRRRRHRPAPLPGSAADGEAPRAERWVEVDVEEAYVHCAKHLPHMVKVPRTRAWGTDDIKRKGGDFFEAARETRPWSDPT